MHIWASVIVLCARWTVLSLLHLRRSLIDDYRSPRRVCVTVTGGYRKIQDVFICRHLSPPTHQSTAPTTGEGRWRGVVGEEEGGDWVTHRGLGTLFGIDPATHQFSHFLTSCVEISWPSDRRPSAASLHVGCIQCLMVLISGRRLEGSRCETAVELSLTVKSPDRRTWRPRPGVNSHCWAGPPLVKNMCWRGLGNRMHVCFFFTSGSGYRAIGPVSKKEVSRQAARS